ncbi:hypothetical protein [Streptomyces scabiei]|uniref:hypothetical protein n=1 Tax=Streptomyces scabiei TaxID=1930 RepID=UPI0029B1FC2C|nr:hypothetical protein [Streptomyces scabiei]MDX3521938.1 hypothetical protein [Streptomyces scabiei]
MSAPVLTGRCLYRAERAYIDEAGVGHEVLCLYATGHTTTGTPMDESDWPEDLDLWHLVFAFDEDGRAIVDPASFDEQWACRPERWNPSLFWLGPPSQVITLRDGQPPPTADVMRQGELHVACGSECTAEGAEFRNALIEFRSERHRHHAALAQIEEAKTRRAALLAEIDQLEAKIGDLLVEKLRRDLDGTDENQ